MARIARDPNKLLKLFKKDETISTRQLFLRAVEKGLYSKSSYGAVQIALYKLRESGKLDRTKSPASEDWRLSSS